jgi:hypothetical protein
MPDILAAPNAKGQGSVADHLEKAEEYTSLTTSYS